MANNKVQQWRLHRIQGVLAKYNIVRLGNTTTTDKNPNRTTSTDDAEYTLKSVASKDH